MGVEGFSNIDGIVYESFESGSIQSAFSRIQQEIEHAEEEWEPEDDEE